MHVTEPVPKLPEKLAWLQPLIDGLMAKQPEQRFATGDEFIAACDRLLAANPQMQAAMRETRTTRKRATMPSFAVPSAPARSIGKNPRLPWLGAGAGVLVVVVATGWLLTHRSPKPTPAATAAAPTSTLSAPPAVQAVPDSNAAADARLATLDLPTLLARADQYFAYGKDNGGEKMGFPPGDNAIDLFHAALTRDPGNAHAVKGLADIAAFYADGAKAAYKNGLYTGADVLVDEGLRADPKNAVLLQLKSQLAKAEQGG
jgi:serine/threonine-protein kinase PpkA